MHWSAGWKGWFGQNPRDWYEVRVYAATNSDSRPKTSLRRQTARWSAPIYPGQVDSRLIDEGVHKPGTGTSLCIIQA